MSNNDQVHRQRRFDPESIHFKTMKTMDRAARLAMMPDYEMYSVDLKEGGESRIMIGITCTNTQ